MGRARLDRSQQIMVVDDDPGQRNLLSGYLESLGFEVVVKAGAEEALGQLREAGSDFGLIVSDVRMPRMTGLEMLREIRRDLGYMLPVLLVTAYADIRDAVEAMRDGAVNYLEKPIDLDELKSCVRQALGVPAEEVTDSQDTLPELPAGIVAESRVVRDLLREASLVSGTDARILITGESGVGKEVIADLVHQWSPRAGAPFMKLNCAAIPENLLESELFGHERGAFTGAVERRIGCFEQSHGGTLLLDEIGEMHPHLQAKLLRVTQSGTFRRVGGMKDLHADVRLLAATNRNLEEEVAQGRFREDLFYRLNVIELHVPPLRERHEDILPLANAFVRAFAGGHPRFSATAVSCLETYSWPGNVRELRNAMERAALMARGDVVLTEHLPRRVYAHTSEGKSPEQESGNRMESIERSVILQTLAECNYNRSETARRLGISRRSLIYKLNRFREEGYSIEP